MGVFYATVLHKTGPVPFDPKNNNRKESALDSGIRTFDTILNNRGTVIEMAPKEVGRIYYLCGQAADMLQSRVNVPRYGQGNAADPTKPGFVSCSANHFNVLDVHYKCASSSMTTMTWPSSQSPTTNPLWKSRGVL